MGYSDIKRDPYTWHTTNLGDAGAPGQIFKGVDNVFGGEAHFRLVKHVNAVTVISGHCASWVAVPAASVICTVTNDVTGGADGNSLAIAAGAYVCVPAQGEYCFIQTWGYHATLRGDGGITLADALMYKAADGQFDTWAGALPQAGEAWATESASVFPGMLRLA